MTTIEERVCDRLSEGALLRLLDWSGNKWTINGGRTMGSHEKPWRELVDKGLVTIERDDRFQVIYAITERGTAVKLVAHRDHDHSDQRALEQVPQLERQVAQHRNREAYDAMERSPIWGSF